MAGLGGGGPYRRSGRGGGGPSQPQHPYTPPADPTQRTGEASGVKPNSAPPALKFGDIPIVYKVNKKKKKKDAGNEKDAERSATPTTEEDSSSTQPSKERSETDTPPTQQKSREREPSRPLSDSASSMPPTNNLEKPATRPATPSELFGHFLRNPSEKKKLNGESMGWYEAQVRIMALCNYTVLKVKFEDLLKDKKYAELAMRIANEKRADELLQPVAREFMKEILSEEVAKKLTLRIIGKPKSMACVQSFSLRQLARKAQVLCKRHEVPDTTPLGRRIYMCVLLHILDNNDEGISWSGSFELRDIYILMYQNYQMQCWIAKETNKDSAEEWSYLDRCCNQDKADDLHKLDKVLTCRYKDGDTLPVYFDVLSSNLQSVSSFLLDACPWYVTYLRFHLALMSSRARKFFLRELYHIICVYGLLGPQRKDEVSRDYSSIFTSKGQGVSWIMTLWDYNDPLLMAVYKFENPMYTDDGPDATKEEASKGNATRGNGAGRNGRRGSADKGNAGRGRAGKGNAGRGKTATHSVPGHKEDRYNDSCGSALAYKRHLIVHLHNHFENPHLIEDIDEIELYAAWRVPWALPFVIQELLSSNKMTGKLSKPGPRFVQCNRISTNQETRRRHWSGPDASLTDEAPPNVSMLHLFCQQMKCRIVCSLFSVNLYSKQIVTWPFTWREFVSQPFSYLL